jgi:hypothetical protein
MPTFLPTIPLSTDQLSISQGNILNNFSILGAIGGNINPASAAINTSIINSGFNWIYLPNNGAIPPTGSAFPTGQAALYGNTNATTAFNEIYINKTTASTTAAGLKQIPSTAMKQVSATQGWAYWPCGMLVKWGQKTFTTTTIDVNFQTDFASPLYDVTNVGLTTGPYFVSVTSVYDGTSATNFDRTSYFQGFNIGGPGTFRVHKQDNGNACIFNYVIYGLGA